MGANQKTSIIIIGAGYGGLSSAIELGRKGFDVHVIEREQGLSELGDIIIFTANATAVMKKWGGVVKELVATSSNPDILTIQDDKGEVLLLQPWQDDHNGNPNVWANRLRTQQMMYDEAVRQGVKFTFGARVTEHWEVDDKAGVYLNGERLSADAVIGADGVYSRTRTYITGSPDAPKGSGFAIYRSFFDLDRLLDDPLTHHLASPGKDSVLVWIGPDTHAIVNINAKTRTIGAFVTHKDTHTVEESWNYPGTVKEMLATVPNWDPVLRAVITKIPEEILVDYKLLWRDPVKKWVSDKGRLAILGDAAHPHLPTSGSGAAQAIEDGGTLGALLEKAGKENIPDALKAFQTLRLERTSLTQRLGWELRHKWHQTNWEYVKKNPEFLALPQPDWLYGADAEQYGHDNYDAVMAHVRKGTPFKNTNLPPDYVHQEWTIDSMMELDKAKAEEELYVVR